MVHNDNHVDPSRKPDIIIDYNKTKAGVDCDKLGCLAVLKDYLENASLLTANFTWNTSFQMGGQLIV